MNAGKARNKIRKLLCSAGIPNAATMTDRDLRSWITSTGVIIDAAKMGGVSIQQMIVEHTTKMWREMNSR